MTAHTTMPTPLGELTLVADSGVLAAVYFPDHRHQRAAESFGRRDDDILMAARHQLTEYFAGERTVFDLPLQPTGNAFQQRVWALLLKIPYGTTRTYGSLAAELGDPGLARAVGAANGRNPLSIVVGCHRVIGAGGKLVGYGGGLPRKQYLLALESRMAPPIDALF